MEIAEPGGTQRREAETATAEPMPDVEAAFEEIEVDAPRVGIIMGSKNDKPKMQPAGEALQQHGIRYEVRVMSAHRDPAAPASGQGRMTGRPSGSLEAEEAAGIGSEA
jgi:AIR carboxylase